MGLTKRISEIIVQNKSLDLKCEFKIVRFGNVIASSGSVVNTFLDQFQKGGPVTLTHKEVERYFMTINEAAGLVLQTIKHAENGDILFLDMGKPVKIYNIVKKIAIAMGKKIKIINKDEAYNKNKNTNEIDLIITGLKKGEKMKEELSDTNKDKNLIHHTSNQKILYIKENNIYKKNIDSLINKLSNNNYNFNIKEFYNDFN